MYVATSPASVQTIAERNPEFVSSINDFGAQIAVAAQLEGAPQDVAIRSAIRRLADAVEKVPQGGGVNTAAYADLIRSSQPSSAAVGFEGGEDPAIADIQSLQAASTAFGALAGGPYRDDKKVRGKVEDFQKSVRDLQSTETLRIERDTIVSALRRAEEALRAMGDFAIAVPG